ncbi:hypothetical protein LEP1GSC047_0218 [Leptospira inadai serovar Lyme str. 10]|uniref:Uncharacterized protein n=2 Tax=Leptospira inadai serovar Lyme TaxID=293084 RepID=V6HTK1_9LEPT|nr:hypothetical protein LEP1GSC047_0218 [Leptospira inadai serovar Lyme str. 10]PNV76731.1 hypothetical protein BES34_000085 [Leptospira inadai serovar Lyme]
MIEAQKSIQPDPLNTVLHKLSRLKDLPHSLLAPLPYQTLWRRKNPVKVHSQQVIRSFKDRKRIRR